MSQDFKDRLARLEAKHGAPTPPPPPTPPAGTRMLDDADKGRQSGAFKGALVGILVAIGLLIGGTLGFLWDDIAVLFPAEQDEERITLLESAMLDRTNAGETE